MASKPKNSNHRFDYKTLGAIPVQADGRIKPLDTIARNNPLILRGKQTYQENEESPKIQGIEWLATMLFFAETADTLKVFVWITPMCSDSLTGNKTISFFLNGATQPQLAKLEEQFQNVNKEPQLRSTYETAIFKLYNSIVRYRSIQFALFDPASLPNLDTEFDNYFQSVIPG